MVCNTPSWSASSTSKYVYPNANLFATGGIFSPFFPPRFRLSTNSFWHSGVPPVVCQVSLSLPQLDGASRGFGGRGGAGYLVRGLTSAVGAWRTLRRIAWSTTCLGSRCCGRRWRGRTQGGRRSRAPSLLVGGCDFRGVACRRFIAGLKLRRRGSLKWSESV